jgi:flagellar basal body rod protein FlgG
MDINTAIALSRLSAQQRAMDVTATNIANAGTPGYQAERTVFADFLSRTRSGETIAFTQDRATGATPRPARSARPATRWMWRCPAPAISPCGPARAPA